MDLSSVHSKSFVFGGVVVGLCAALFCYAHCGGCEKTCNKKYSIPNQPLRFAQAKEQNNSRMLDIDSVYKPDFVRGKVVVVTGTVFFALHGLKIVTFLILFLRTLKRWKQGVGLGDCQRTGSSRSSCLCDE
jgi:hypothetical protein